MTSLFSPFDLGLFEGVFLPCSISVFVFLSKVPNFCLWDCTLKEAMHPLSSFFSSLKPRSFNKSALLIVLSTLSLLAVCNLISVFPYSFPVTAQISVIFFLAASMWLSFVAFSLAQNWKGFLSHLIPEGTPLLLTLLLFLIEIISSLIRPLTLTVRLVANILAGHLLMSLLSSLVFAAPACSTLYVGLNLVEIFVALIQSYIFCTMITLYYSEA